MFEVMVIGHGADHETHAYERYAILRDRVRSFGEVGAMMWHGYGDVEGGGSAMETGAFAVTRNFFTLLASGHSGSICNHSGHHHPV